MKDTLVLLLLGATLVTAGIGLHRTSEMYERVLRKVEAQPMATMTTGPWMSGGLPQTYTTTRGENETEAEHAARHRVGLTAMLEQFPKDE